MLYRTVTRDQPEFYYYIVPLRGLEPPRHWALDPKSSVFTNYTTAADEKPKQDSIISNRDMDSNHNTPVRRVLPLNYLGIPLFLLLESLITGHQPIITLVFLYNNHRSHAMPATLFPSSLYVPNRLDQDVQRRADKSSPLHRYRLAN